MAEQPELLEEEVVSRIVEEVLERFRYHGHRTWGDKPIVLGNPLWLPYYWNNFGTFSNQAGTANRVFLTPIYFPAPMTISRITAYVVTAGGAGTFLRLGIYADNGGTPDGGALLDQSGNIVATTTTAKEYALAVPLAFAKGVSAWAALETQDAVVNFIRLGGNLGLWTEVGVEKMISCYYDLGGFGNLTNPCPATVLATSRFLGFARVDSVQPL